jgi:hypothetical protein
MKSKTPAYYKVILTQAQSVKAQECMQRDGYAQLHIEVEIVELGQGMTALSWVWVQGGSRAGVLRQCNLSPAQWAECMMIINSGCRPVYKVSWDLLGELEDGTWGAASGTVGSLERVPCKEWGELNKLTGLEA